MADGPLIVQSDRTVLLEVAHPLASEARHALAVFAELERAPEHIHTYRITRLGLWNARAAGHSAEEMLAVLERYSKFAVPTSVAVDLTETVNRYGRLVIDRVDSSPDAALRLRSDDPSVLAEVANSKRVAPLLTDASMPAVSRSQPGRAANSNKSWSNSAGRRKTWPDTPLALRTSSASTRIELRPDGICANTSSRPSITSSPAVPGWWCFPAVPVRRSSAQGRWRRPRPRR